MRKLILAAAAAAMLAAPMAAQARWHGDGGHWGGHPAWHGRSWGYHPGYRWAWHGGRWGWWPLAVLGGVAVGAAVTSPYYYQPYPYYYAPQPRSCYAPQYGGWYAC
jgi:hypothetical protein